ncbi:MAG: LegC family aminotransferase [Deltaproteobacteria bacterium]|uniref:LegC family aminotransferase n=1 Tax=Candidatus Zymogenus saltonus TaxID=2844893 RepID=A0A9D8KEW1_9DELT|nr:LegC family aminotransferase [Candidatus Zymogenus saltonus]
MKGLFGRKRGKDDFIPLCIPEMGGNEWKYLKECLDTNFVSSVGPFVDRFEEAVARYVKRKYAVATVNGTAALHISLLVSGIVPDDEVLVSTLTFIAPVNAVRYVGAFPVFIDAEKDFWQMDTRKVIDFIEKRCAYRKGALINVETGRTVRAIMPVHILGHPVDMDPILEIAEKYNLIVIEDATESLGAQYKGKMTGSLGEIACFSFNGNKIITTGGGGMIVTDNEKLARRAKYLTTQAKDDPVEYIHNEIGYNFRLTNIQAALGCAQMERLDRYIEKKKYIADIYTGALKDLPGITPLGEADWAWSIFWMYTILLDEGAFGIDSRTLLNRLAKKNIQTRPLWQPIHLSPAHRGATASDCSVSEYLYKTGLTLPCSVAITDSEIERVIDQIQSHHRNK